MQRINSLDCELPHPIKVVFFGNAHSLRNHLLLSATCFLQPKAQKRVVRHKSKQHFWRLRILKLELSGEQNTTWFYFFIKYLNWTWELDFSQLFIFNLLWFCLYCWFLLHSNVLGSQKQVTKTTTEWDPRKVNKCFLTANTFDIP